MNKMSKAVRGSRPFEDDNSRNSSQGKSTKRSRAVHKARDRQNGISESDLISRKEAAAYLNIQAHTLATWATAKRQDLPYYKIGRLAMYRKSDLEKFIEAGSSQSVGD